MIQRPRPPVELVHSRDEEAPPEPPGPPRYIARGILPFFDSSLWAVLFAVVAHLATFIALVLLRFFVDRSIPAAGAIAMLLVLSTIPIRDEWVWRRRLGSVTGLVVAIWGSGAGLAWVAKAYGVY